MAEFLVTADPKLLPPSYYKNVFTKYLIEKQSSALMDLLIKNCGPQEHTSFIIKFPDLHNYDPTFAYFVVNYPKLMVPLMDDTLLELQNQLSRHPDIMRMHGNITIKNHCHSRLTHLPPLFSITKPTINDINSISDQAASSSMIQFCGTITRTSGIRMLEVSKQYECQNPKCKFRFMVYADPEQGNMLPQPRTCPSRPSEGGKSCNSSNLREVEGSKDCVDYQEIKVQDKMEHIQLGSIPRSLVVTVDSDLVDKFRPGDDVIIVGTIIRQWRPVLRGARILIDIAVRAHSIRDMNSHEISKNILVENIKPKFDAYWSLYTDRPFERRNDILRSICSQLYGMYYVKLCLLLTLIGGSMPLESNQSNSTEIHHVRRRYQSHILFIGDPGCGKSQLLRFAAGVSRRSVLTTGVGTTGAGLTCSMVKDGNDWEVEAGALVLANDGVCCIDEFASVKEQDRATIHEAMEQQTLSIAKAGVVVKLNTRATVIACCNPKGSYDPTLDISSNTAIASPLLSRFDLVLILLDIPNKDWDKKVSTFLLERAVGDMSIASDHNDSINSNNNKYHHHNQRKDRQLADNNDVWDINTLSQYINYVKSNYQPEISAEARALLMRYYQMQRQSDDRSSSRTTVRLLESLVRLSESHAKLMRRDKVLLCDAVVAITCMSLSQTKASILENNSTLQSDFPIDGDAFYQEEEKKVFENLLITKERFLDTVSSIDNTLDSTFHFTTLFQPESETVSTDIYRAVSIHEIPTYTCNENGQESEVANNNNNNDMNKTATVHSSNLSLYNQLNTYSMESDNNKNNMIVEKRKYDNEPKDGDRNRLRMKDDGTNRFNPWDSMIENRSYEHSFRSNAVNNVDMDELYHKPSLLTKSGLHDEIKQVPFSLSKNSNLFGSQQNLESKSQHENIESMDHHSSLLKQKLSNVVEMLDESEDW